MPIRRAVTGRSQDPRARFAEELRACRQRYGKTLREVGKEITWDHSHLGRMELGETLGGPEMVQDLDRLYGTDYLIILWELAQKDPSQFRARYRRYMEMEAEATGIQIYAPCIVPGLLQAEGYARAVLTAGGLTGKELDQQVTARLGRQETLRSDRAPRVRVIMSETVLRSPVQGSAVWQAQLEKLLVASELPNMVIQVVPLAAGVLALTNTHVNFLKLPDLSTVAWVETSHAGELVEESKAVDRLLLSYDQVRDEALPAAESRKLISDILEDVPCDPPSI